MKLKVNAAFPEKLAFLFEAHRYKVLYGGRGGAKSWGAARALLIQGTQRVLRILCTRETQTSIDESVHHLLSEQIKALGLEKFYTVQKYSIMGVNGTEFIFAGLKQTSITNLKSYESVDKCWVEEAQTVSKTSWDVLIPTIRKEGSEIWATFNPVLETDDTYKRFVLAAELPPGAKVVKVNWSDNPWFPKVLEVEKDHLKATDPDAYLHVWEGHCRQVLDGAIYANELRAATAEGRIMRVPYDRSKPVFTFWDLGFADNTSIWFVQSFPWEYRLIDFENGCQLPLQHYLKRLQARPYVYGLHYLPHDAKAKTLGTGKSVIDLMIAAGFRCQLVPKLSISEGINAARTIFPQCWFDEDRTADGIQAMRHYQWGKEGADGQQKREPLHNWASHPADAFRTFAVGIKAPKQQKPASARKPPVYVSAWS